MALPSRPLAVAPAPLLRLVAITKRFGGREGLWGITLEIAAGEFLTYEAGESASGTLTSEYGNGSRAVDERIQSCLRHKLYRRHPRLIIENAGRLLVDVAGLEPATPCLQSTRVASNPSIHHC